MTKRMNHFPDFKVKVAFEAIREDMTMAELPKNTACIYYRPVFAGKHSGATQIGTWRRAAIKNMATGFSKRGGDQAQTDDAGIDKRHPKIGQLVVEPIF